MITRKDPVDVKRLLITLFLPVVVLAFLCCFALLAEQPPAPVTAVTDTNEKLALFEAGAKIQVLRDKYAQTSAQIAATQLGKDRDDAQFKANKLQQQINETPLGRVLIEIQNQFYAAQQDASALAQATLKAHGCEHGNLEKDLTLTGCTTKPEAPAATPAKTN